MRHGRSSLVPLFYKLKSPTCLLAIIVKLQTQHDKLAQTLDIVCTGSCMHESHTSTLSLQCSVDTNFTDPRVTVCKVAIWTYCVCADAEAMEATGRGEVTSASMSVSLGQGITVAAAVMTTGGNADSALADVLDRVVPAPTSRWAAMVEEAPPAVSYNPRPPSVPCALCMS